MDSDSDRLQGARPSLHSGPVPVGRIPAVRPGSGPLLENLLTVTCSDVDLKNKT